MQTDGDITLDVTQGVASLNFHHSKRNALTRTLLNNLAGEITQLGAREDVRVIVLRSSGDEVFCAGAYFHDLLGIETFEQGKEFFLGFARLILAMKSCPKFIIARVHGKAIGGGVGIVAATDHAFALGTASIKLSELDLGLGPFVVGPPIERKLGVAAFSALATDTSWRDAAWARHHGLYAEVFETVSELDAATATLASRLSRSNPEAMAKLKAVFWEGTEHWDTLLKTRAEISGRLVLSDYTVKALAAAKASKS
ncbi:MAG TPA: enoyl-CoA hydratase/isomerase family protein [Verrucomicrobiae bacterium]|jgi:methylglutaconyl-CoA hydratase